MFTNIYRPDKLSKFVGNETAILPFIQWLLNWSQNVEKKCLLISGNCGIGKSLLVELILKKHDYNIIELGIDENRDKTSIQDKLKLIIQNKYTFNNQQNALVISDIDSFSEHGFIATLLECIKITCIPIIFICNNRYDSNIKPILNYCFDIKMTTPEYKDVYNFICEIIKNEKIKINESVVHELYETSNGDIRFMLNTLQFGNKIGIKNIESSNIFETTGKLLTIDETIESKYKTYWLSNDLHLLMVQENYINNTLNVQNITRKMDNISYSADKLSDADLFEKNINMCNWEIEPYKVYSLIDATTKCNKKTILKFPQYLSKISLINKNNQIHYYDKFIKEKPVKEKPIKEKPVKEKPVKEKPIKEKPIKEKPIKEKPVKEKPIKEKPVKEKPVKEKPIKEKPVKEKPIKEKPVKEKPIKEKPIKEKPIKEKPIKEKPIKEKPVKEKIEIFLIN